MSARIWKSAKAWDKCAHQKLLVSPFDEHEVADLRKDIITILELGGVLVLERQTSDRRDLPVDWRLLGLVSGRLRRTWDAGGTGSYASGVAIGVGVKLPRILPSFQKEEKNGGSHRSADRKSSSRQQRWRMSSETLTVQPSTWTMQSRWCSKTRSQRRRLST